MIAEIYKKAHFQIEGKEDILTGNFFGAIAYTEYFGDMLGPILREVYFGEEENTQFLDDLASIDRLKDYKIKFWKKFDSLNGKKEPDLFLEFEDFVICIEVKYHSGLSGKNQLVTYTQILKEYCENKSKRGWLILLAKQPYAKEIFESETLKDIEKTGIDGFGYLSWQNVHKAIKKLSTIPLYATRIQKDLLDYLQAKGLNGFTRFPVDIYREFSSFANIKELLNTRKIQLHMIDLETRQNISNAFAAVHEIYNSVQALIHELDCNFGAYKSMKVEGSKSVGNYMTWQSFQETHGWMQTVFFKVYQNPKHPDKLFLIEIDLSGDIAIGMQIRFALHKFIGSIPNGFKVNEGWLYNQRRTKSDHFDMDLEKTYSIPKTEVINNDRRFYNDAHNKFIKAWFSSSDLFEVKKEELEQLVISHFDALLEKCMAEEKANLIA